MIHVGGPALTAPISPSFDGTWGAIPDHFDGTRRRLGFRITRRETYVFKISKLYKISRHIKFLNIYIILNIVK